MSNAVIEQVISELAGLPTGAQAQVLDFIAVLKSAQRSTISQAVAGEVARYPLRGEPYVYLVPFAPALPPEAWDAVRGEII